MKTKPLAGEKRFVVVKNFPTSGGRLCVNGDVAEVIREYIELASDWSGKPDIPMIVAVNHKWPMPLHLQPHQFEPAPAPKEDGVEELPPQKLGLDEYYLAKAEKFMQDAAKMDNTPVVYMVAAAFKNEERAQIAEAELRRLKSEETAEDAWIPVERELPSIGRTVIVAGGIAYRLEDEWISQTGAASGRPIMWPITHWMPIPELPVAPPSTAKEE